jgi:hypothetical protein
VREEFCRTPARSSAQASTSRTWPPVRFRPLSKVIWVPDEGPIAWHISDLHAISNKTLNGRWSSWMRPKNPSLGSALLRKPPTKAGN